MSGADPKNFIVIKGARQHNLKGIDLNLPKRNLVVITGPSGSGKSSLAFHTIFAEGQRRYVESLNSYARQFLKRMDKPDVDVILGLSPAIAIQQQTLAKNPRSTVATQTEIYDHLRMLYAQIGKTISPVSGEEVTRESPRSVARSIQETLPDGTRYYVTFEVQNSDDRLPQVLDSLRQRGFSRLCALRGSTIVPIDLNLAGAAELAADHNELFVVQDRLIVRTGDEAAASRVADSVEQAFGEGGGSCSIMVLDARDPFRLDRRIEFNVRFERDGVRFELPSPNLFSFNSPLGACRDCKGFGTVKGPDRALVIPDTSKSILAGAILPFESSVIPDIMLRLVGMALESGIDLDTPYAELSRADRWLIWHGKGEYPGILGYFAELESAWHRRSVRFHHARYQGRMECLSCSGTRLCEDALYVEVGGKTIGDVVKMTVQDARAFFAELTLTAYEQVAAGILLEEIRKRLRFLEDVGLAYLTLGRMSQTLSGGESQRISLATSLGSALVGALYVLDEPTIGLHPRDTLRLIDVLQKLRDLGNTVIVVEHDTEVMQHAGHIVDLGPASGLHGGQVMFTGTLDQMRGNGQASLTGAYLNGRKSIAVPSVRRQPDWDHRIRLEDARINNLKSLDVDIPLDLFVCITGVSGSGKSSLVEDTLVPAVQHALYKRRTGISGYLPPYENYDEEYPDERTLPHLREVTFPKILQDIIVVDQSPVGLSNRSNPASYTKVFSHIRDILSSMPQSRMNGYKPGFFSFNIDGGRCEECKGEGSVTIDMQFLADLHLPCEACNGTRFGQEALMVEYRGKNIDDMLSLTIDEALVFFHDKKALCGRLQVLSDIGLGYLKLGQPLPTLSGGEAQRVKLAAHMGNRNAQAVFVFDEPTTGLHTDDVGKLIKALNRIIEDGNSVIVIEHNLELIKCADWVIDMGPEGGDAGGQVVAAGPPEHVAAVEASYTGQFLRSYLPSA